MMTWLLFRGFVRSLEFTSLNAIVFAEIDASKMSRAVSFSSAAQQLSLSVGVAAGAGALQGFALLNPGAEVLVLENFKWAFVTMAIVSVSAAAVFLRLPPDAGLISSRALPKPQRSSRQRDNKAVFGYRLAALLIQSPAHKFGRTGAACLRFHMAHTGNSCFSRASSSCPCRPENLLARKVPPSAKIRKRNRRRVRRGR